MLTTTQTDLHDPSPTPSSSPAVLTLFQVHLRDSHKPSPTLREILSYAPDSSLRRIC
jgi:hypothetical protein